MLYLELASLTFVNLTIIAVKSFRMPQRRGRGVIIKPDQRKNKYKEQKSTKPEMYFLEQQRFNKFGLAKEERTQHYGTTLIYTIYQWLVELHWDRPLLIQSRQLFVYIVHNENKYLLFLRLGLTRFMRDCGEEKQGNSQNKPLLSSISYCANSFQKGTSKKRKKENVGRGMKNARFP